MQADHEQKSIVTHLAVMTLFEPGWVEQRFHPGARLDLIGFKENRDARFSLTGGSPHVMLSVMPSNIDFDVQVTAVDHFAPERGTESLMALAVVAQDNVAEMVTKLYFSYFPPEFRFRIFAAEPEARAWLIDQRVVVVPSAVS